MKRLYFSCYILVLWSLALSAAPNSNVQSLAGSWRFQLDPATNGLSSKWFESTLAGQIRLPGSTDEAKVSPTNTAKPNLDGLYRLRPYFGPAWYQRDLEIPAGWSGKRVRLFIERAHWETQAWLDGKPLGSQDSLISPQTYELGSDLAPGKHQLTLCVNNQLKYNLGWFVSIHYEGTQTSWNGMIGRIELLALDPVSLEDLQVYPEVDRNLARVKFKPANPGAASFLCQRPSHAGSGLPVA